MTSNLVDFFLRRTEMLFFESQKVEQIAQIVFNEFISYFSWNKEILKKQYDELHVELKRIKQFTS
jgi:glycerol-3-phosphate dehydrogenase